MRMEEKHLIYIKHCAKKSGANNFINKIFYILFNIYRLLSENAYFHQVIINCNNKLINY